MATYHTCRYCHGSGRIPCTRCGGDGKISGSTCSFCHGNKTIVCPSCDGRGQVED